MIHGLDKRLQKLRTERRLSQKEVATAIGISTSLLSNYESCERTPSVENLIALASFYRCMKHLSSFQYVTVSARSVMLSSLY